MAKPVHHQQHYDPNYQSQHLTLPAGKPWALTTDNGITLRGEFIESATGSDAPVLHFAHGNGLCARVYEHFLAYAHPQFALFLHDSQGHGASDNGDEQQHPFVGWNGSSERMVAVIRQQQEQGFLKGRRLLAAGHSFGGALTYLAAAKHPDLFERLVLFDAMMFPPLLSAALAATTWVGMNNHHPMAKQARNRGAWWQDLPAAFQYFYKRGMLAQWHDDCVYSYLHHSLEPQNNGVGLRCAPWIEASVFANRPVGIWKQIKRIEVPVQLFYGANTYPFIRPAVGRCVRSNRHIQAQEMAGDHFFMLQKPDCLPEGFWANLAAA